MITTYLDDCLLLGQGFLSRDYSSLREKVLSDKKNMTGCVDNAGEIYGYTISKNVPVSSLYMRDVFTVKFALSRVNKLHSDSQAISLSLLCFQLKQYIMEHPAYYIIRLPIHIMDLVRAFNEIQDGMYFCGGTTEQIAVSAPPEVARIDGGEVFIASPSYITQHSDDLRRIIAESFYEYSSQYHVNPATEDKACDVYTNWISAELESPKQNSIAVAAYNNRPIGLSLYHENEIGIEGLLVAVDQRWRGLHAQQAIYALLSRKARAQQKVFVSSTQLDNFISAGNMNAIGMRPFYGIYNYHIDSHIIQSVTNAARS